MIKISKKRFGIQFLITAFLIGAILFTSYSCSTSDDYITRAEARRLVEEALRSQANGLSEAEINRLIDDAIRLNNNNLEFTQWEIVNITANANDWQWNNNTAQWEVYFDLPELTEFIYESGAMISYVFIGQQGVDEVQKLLPYINTYSFTDDYGSSTFTETISADFQYGNPSTVAFFIKDSDLADDPNAPQNYNFRIVLIW
jgi:hypothetical protein